MNICMYVCMYVLYAYIRVCMHQCVYPCMYICMHVCIHVCIYVIFKLGFEWYGVIVLVGRGIVRGNCPGEVSEGIVRGNVRSPVVSAFTSRAITFFSLVTVSQTYELTIERTKT